MYKDIFGKTRLKLGLHLHTTISDGRKSPEMAATLYRSAGFDAVAFTDHWVAGESREVCGLPVIAGCEYNVGANDASEGIYHILGLFMAKKPFIMRGATPQEMIDKIHDAGGIAILAHPAWSLNTPEKIMKLRRLDGIEIYNSVSGVGYNRRPDSSLIIDTLAANGYVCPLVAADDSHDYGDECGMSYIMLECDSLEREAMLAAYRAGRFYSTQGPEIHLRRLGDTFRVDCTAAREIGFMSNLCFVPRIFTGDALTEAVYRPRQNEKFIRAYVVDKDGKMAWSNIITI